LDSFQLIDSKEPPCSYSGINANREWQTLSGCTTTVPLEQDTGSPGSDCGHWAESVFEDEILSPVGSEVDSPLSRLTIAAIEDLGYTVDYGKAEEYTLQDSQQCNNNRRLARKLSQAQEEARADAIKHGKDLLGSQFTVTSSVEGRNHQLVVVSVIYLDPDTGKTVSIIVRGEDP